MTNASNNPTDLPIGSLIVDRYRIDRVLGVGGFGITYRAFDVSLERTVAIKELFSPGAWRDANSLRVMTRDNEEHRTATSQFVQEGRSLAKFSSPSIVRVHDSFEANSTAYLVMELLAGPTLEELVQANGPLSQAQLSRVLNQLAGALEEVHANGLLHQDVSPSNVIMTQDQNVAVLVDFGAARNVVAQRSHDLARIVKGGYSPLEQYSSGPIRDGKTDVYALAATLYFSATGVVPVDAPSRASGAEIPSPMELNPQTSPEMSAAILRALSIGSPARPDLRSFVAEATNTGHGPSSPKTTILDPMATPNFRSPPGPSAPPTSWPEQSTPKKKRGLALGLGSVAVALSGVVVALLLRSPQKLSSEASAQTTAVAPGNDQGTGARSQTSDTEIVTPPPSSAAANESTPATPTEATKTQSPIITVVEKATTLPPPLETVATKSAQTAAFEIQTQVIGQSLRNRTIELISTGQGTPRVLIVGGLSGELAAGPGVARDIVSMVAASDLAQQVTVAVIPDPNPDGRASNLRTNSRGVDLNRNFPASDFEPSAEHGSGPLSEPESKAVADAIQLFRPTLVISLIGTKQEPFTNFDGSGRNAATTFSRASGYPLTSSGSIAPTPGSLGGWVGVDNNVPVVVVAYEKSVSAGRAWAETEDAFKTLLESL
jgi:serine/threonine protein kinase